MKKDSRARRLRDEMNMLKQFYLDAPKSGHDLAPLTSVVELAADSTLTVARELALAANPGLASALLYSLKGPDSVAVFDSNSTPWGGLATIQELEGENVITSLYETTQGDGRGPFAWHTAHDQNYSFSRRRELSKDMRGNDVYTVAVLQEPKRPTDPGPTLEKRETVRFTEEGLLTYEFERIAHPRASNS